ncbi:MAG TPA: Dabb family protein [Methylomirabilota bacterium]|nr:Dabb family protein [Methylomirabilota bacterium]
MKTLALILTIAATILFTMTAEAAQPAKTKKLQHVVAFKFKDTASQADIEKVITEFRGLQKKIKEIKGFEWGTNNSPEKHNKGTTHGFILTFKSEADRDIYLKHPEHEKFGKLVGPLLADVFVIDFWAQK